MRRYIMIFEKADINDSESLVKLRIDYLTEDYGSIPENQLSRIAGNLPDYFSRHLNRDLFVFVCRNNDVIVSCCFLYVSEKPSNPAFITGKTGTVLNVYTRPEYRKKGLAGKLLSLMLSASKEMGLDFVELKSTESGYNLYRSLGFEEVVSKYRNMKYVFGSHEEIN